MYQLKKGLLREFSHEAQGTKSLFKSIPQSALNHRSQPHLWSIRELAIHIADIYSWYHGVLHLNVLDLSTVERKLDANISIEQLQLDLDQNIENANHALETWNEDSYLEPWTLVFGEKTLIPPTPKIGMIRGMLFSHLYHHRGEMVALLRTLGHPVPGLYGPTYEEMS